jgi:hypothetical protein
VTRPLDYGKELPDDSNDSAPASPTAGFSEVDNLIHRVKEIQTEWRRDFVPDIADARPDEIIPRSNWAGVIFDIEVDGVNGNDALSPDGNRYFKIMRQDGFTVKAHILSYTEPLGIGDPVSLTRGAAEDEWIFTCTPRKPLTPFINVGRLTELAIPLAGGPIKLGTVFQQNPAELLHMGKQHFKNKPDGTVKYIEENAAYCEIGYTITVKLAAPTPAKDLPIGSVIMWALGVDVIPAGWAHMDGTANAAGSGIDMRGYFTRGAVLVHAPDGVAAGSDTHDHDGNTGGFIADETGTTGTDPVVFVIDENHRHTISSDSNVPEHKSLHFIERIS